MLLFIIVSVTLLSITNHRTITNTNFVVDAYTPESPNYNNRRRFLVTSFGGITASYLGTSNSNVISNNPSKNNNFIANAVERAAVPNLEFTKSSSGLQWADAKIGTGPTASTNSYVTIDYVLSTTGARYGTKIYSTADSNTPYRWKLGNGSTIKGIEDAVIGTEDVPPMRPGGIRRLIIPSYLAYESLPTNYPTSCDGSDSKTSIGPIPPKSLTDGPYQRFVNIYCNPRRQYQPDLVIDIKLYGKRTIE